MKRSHTSLSVCVLLALLLCWLGGCAKSREQILRDRSATVERKLEDERNRVLSSGEIANSARGGRDGAISHLQTLRGALSVVNVSITGVPLFLTADREREMGYSVLDEALGTIDWNIPLYQTGGGAGGVQARPYPALFSPQSGLNFSAIRGGAGAGGAGTGPTGIAK